LLKEEQPENGRVHTPPWCIPCANEPQYKEKRGERGDVNISQDIRFRVKTDPVASWKAIITVTQDRVTHYGIIHARLITIGDFLLSINIALDLYQSKVPPLLQCCRIIQSRAQ
jgi:hypothetical protein